jgi:hypothetical protein
MIKRFSNLNNILLEYAEPFSLPPHLIYNKDNVIN